MAKSNKSGKKPSKNDNPKSLNRGNNKPAKAQKIIKPTVRGR